MSGPRDRATVVATTLVAILANRLRDPATREEIAKALREEFEEIARQVRNELRLD
jgi:hypothetical protein